MKYSKIIPLVIKHDYKLSPFLKLCSYFYKSGKNRMGEQSLCTFEINKKFMTFKI